MLLPFYTTPHFTQLFFWGKRGSFFPELFSYQTHIWSLELLISIGLFYFLYYLPCMHAYHTSKINKLMREKCIHSETGYIYTISTTHFLLCNDFPFISINVSSSRVVQSLISHVTLTMKLLYNTQSKTFSLMVWVTTTKLMWWQRGQRSASLSSSIYAPVSQFKCSSWVWWLVWVFSSAFTSHLHCIQAYFFYHSTTRLLSTMYARI